MKRGISFALQAAGMGLACLATTLKQPVHASGALTAACDTAYYYNEQGVELYCAPEGSGTFVIRTCKKKEEIYYDWDKVSKAIKKDTFDVIEVKSISFEEAKKVEALICNGYVEDSLVKNNVVRILDRNLIRKIFAKIPDSGTNTDSLNDFREYGGTIFKDKPFSFHVGGIGNPCDSGVAVEFREEGIAYYHSHPSGERKVGDCYYIQGPSLKDQEALMKGKKQNKKKKVDAKGYVFGMNKRSHLIYIFDKDGIKATLPFFWFLCCSVNK
ncbi:hypothetical protein [Niastella populi]|uniref:Uncharacterized protein n=1 Tax=Niastella populi TaxID=550983 RepID=A0A1V9FXH9_9BACT|nr:hypothetical protein [Niastella populi]OQP63043.1 hypothetical protein A4R26_17865 [Niastella populi]